MRILYIVNIPSPYRVKYFNELGQVEDVTVLFERASHGNRDNSWKEYSFSFFKGVICKGKKWGDEHFFSLEPIKYIKKFKNDWIIIGNAISITGMFEIMYLKMHKIPYWLEGDGAFPDSVGLENLIKRIIKKFLIHGASGYLSTCDMHEKYYLKYGAEKNKIYRYPFSSIEEKDILKRQHTKEEKQQLRHELGMHEKKIIISVGQFIYRKGFDILIKATEDFDNQIGIYIIGGDRMDGIERRENIHILPFQQKERLLKYYDAADLFVLPTREDIWGLVINEAMARGLPIISTDRCNAALELIEDGLNGFIIPVNDYHTLGKKIEQILFEMDANIMGQNSLDIIRNYTIQKMVEEHIKIFHNYVI